MNKITILSVFFLGIVIFHWNQVLGQLPKKNIPGIIFDTDMGPDYDDAGAITILYALAAKQECKILATTASNKAACTAPAIEAFNRFFGHSEIPVGVASSNAPEITPSNHWTDTIARKYLHSTRSDKVYPSAVSVYRRALACQPDKSVIIITVGFLSNLEDLLKSTPDEWSPLSGRELIQRKVKKYVAMAGRFPEGKEFNVYKDAAASRFVIPNWPTPILFSGFEIGEKIMTGKQLVNSSVSGPTKDAYRYCLKTYGEKPAENRSSWDQTAVLCAIRNPEKYFYLSNEGTFLCKEDGSDSWNPDLKKSHYFLIHKYPYQVIADELEKFMQFQPSGVIK